MPFVVVRTAIHVFCRAYTFSVEHASTSYRHHQSALTRHGKGRTTSHLPYLFLVLVAEASANCRVAQPMDSCAGRFRMMRDSEVNKGVCSMCEEQSSSVRKRGARQKPEGPTWWCGTCKLRLCEHNLLVHVTQQGPNTVRKTRALKRTPRTCR